MGPLFGGSSGQGFSRRKRIQIPGGKKNCEKHLHLPDVKTEVDGQRKGPFFKINCERFIFFLIRAVLRIQINIIRIRFLLIGFVHDFDLNFLRTIFCTNYQSDPDPTNYKSGSRPVTLNLTFDFQKIFQDICPKMLIIIFRL